MSSPRVLRIQRSDEPEAFVLVHVSHTGPAPLDLMLTATEGESPYISFGRYIHVPGMMLLTTPTDAQSAVKQSRLKDLRAKNYQGTDEEWSRIVSLVLGHASVSVDESGWSSGVEALASISGSGDEDKEIVITIRKRVQAITVRDLAVA